MKARLKLIYIPMFASFPKITPLKVNIFPFTARNFSSIKPAKSLLIFNNNKLTLLHQKYDTTYHLISEKNLNDNYYRQVKAVTHVPLYLHTLLLNSTPSKKNDELKQLLDKIHKAKKDISLPNEADVEIQLLILEKTEKFISDLLAQNLLDEIDTRNKVENFFENLKSEFEFNLKLGAKIQLSNLDNAMLDLMKTFSINLNNNHTVLMAPTGPRNNLIEHQYFTQLYKSHFITTKNIFYIEKIPQDLCGIDILKDIPSLLYSCDHKIAEPSTSALESSNSSSKTCLEKLNLAFLHAHSIKSKTMLAAIETVIIYSKGNITLWKFNDDCKDFECVTSIFLNNIQSFKNIFLQFQKDYKLSFEKNRIIIAGESLSEKDIPLKKYILDFYAFNSIKNAENQLVYYVESIPIDGNIKNHYIDKFLAGAELNKTYGEVVAKDKTLMFSDVLGKYAPPVLFDLFKRTRLYKGNLKTTHELTQQAKP